MSDSKWISDIGGKREKDMFDVENTATNYIDKLRIQMEETQEEFIFRTISEFAANNYATTIEKDELVRAIQLIRMSKEYGPGIDERWTTATEQSYMCHRAYIRGYRDGVEKEHARLSAFIKEG